MSQKHQIFAFHLLNDRSGSPKVLSQLLKDWVNKEKTVHLHTSKHEHGFLSRLNGVNYHYSKYQFKEHPWLRLIYFVKTQLVLMFTMFFHIKKGDLVYINTVLPFGAAILGKLKGCRVIYHVHESTVNPPILKWFLFKILGWTASEVINVSKYVAQSHQIKTIPNHLVYNALDEGFIAEMHPKTCREHPKNVMMVCSLKAYKGVFEFIDLAKSNPKFQFRLVLNAEQSAISAFFKTTNIPSNTTIFPAQNNLHTFYQWADVILNLSRPDGWIETFGLTIIEGMAYGLPAIVPPVGGILEVIEEGITGYSVDSRQKEELNNKLNQLLGKSESYKAFSAEAKKRVLVFKEQLMLQNIDAIIQKNRP